MATRDQWKRRLLAAELLSLLILVASLLLLRSQSPTTEGAIELWLLIPAVASLTTFLSFLGLMYIRWIKSAVPGTRRTLQNAIFAFMALTLLSIWALAISQTWQSLEKNPGQEAPNLPRK